MNYSSTEDQRHYRIADKVCGSRTSEIAIWDDEKDNNYFFNFTELCALWDSSCGNETLARDHFYEFTYFIRLDVCFGDTLCQCIVDGKTAPASIQASYASLLSYARSPRCTSGYEYLNMACCGITPGACSFRPTFVEIYYWPTEDANTSCLSIVGESVKPWEYGATLTTTTTRCDWHGCPPNFSRVGTYWGCEISSSIYTTATMTSINGFTFKSLVINPWATDNPCLTTSPTSAGYDSNSTAAQDFIVRPRALAGRIVPTGYITSTPVSTVTLDGFTFTSPSVYVNFIGLQAVDDCGPIQTANSIYTTMIAFDADELSTIAGNGYLDEFHATERVKPFDFADLPCPPQSVMEANWYKPAPGEPYLPRLAFPTKLKSIDPLWSGCTPGPFFTAFDPPRTLVPVSAMVSDTTVDPPSATDAPYPQGSQSAASPRPAPVQTPVLDQPKPTTTSNTSPGSSNGRSGVHLPVPTLGNSPGDDTSSDGEPVGVAGAGDQETIELNPHGDTNRNSVDPGGTDPKDSSGRPPFVTSIAGHAATHIPGIITIDSTTLAKGDPPITISGTVVSLGSTALIAASETLPLPTKPGVFTSIASNAATFVPNAVAIAGMTLMADGLPLSLPDTVVSIGSSAIFIAPSPLPLPHSKQDAVDVAGSRATLRPDGVMIAGTTHRAGDPPFTLSGYAMSVDSSFLMMGTKTVPFPQSRQTADAAVTAAAGVDQDHGITLGELFTHETPMSLASNGDLVIGDKTLRRGGATASIDGTVMSLMSNGNLLVDGTTLSPGGAAITMHGTVVSVDTDGNMVVDGTALEPGDPGITEGWTSSFSAFHDALVVDGTTLKSGASAITLDGISISLLPGQRLVLDGTTLTPAGAAMTFHGTPISLALNGNPVFDGTTLTPGAAGVTIYDVSISLAADGNLVIDGTTMRHESAYSAAQDTPISIASNGNPVFDGATLTPGGAAATMNGISVSLAPDGNLVIGDTTLTPGGAGITVDGVSISVASDNHIAVTISKDSDDGLGSLIMGGFGPGPSRTSATSSSASIDVVAFEGTAARSNPCLIYGLIMLMGILLVILF